MIIIDLLYLSIFSFFRRFLNKYSFDTPEVVALGFLGFLNGFTLNVLYYYCLHDSANFSKKIGGIVLLIGIVGTCVGFYFRYIPKNKYIELYKKYKTYLIIPGLVVLGWIYFLVTNIIKIYD